VDTSTAEETYLSWHVVDRDGGAYDVLLTNLNAATLAALGYTVTLNL